MGKITVVTGERGAGKSEFCLRELARTGPAGLRTGGIISPAVYETGRKTAFFTLDVRTGEKRLCGARAAYDAGAVGCWKLDPDTMEWGNGLIHTACPCDVLFIDELGPLEFEQHAGYTAAFDVLRSGGYENAFVVIRPTLLSVFGSLFPDHELITLKEGHVSLD